MLRLLRKPRWIAFTALVLVLVVVMVNLALWQLRRLDERQAQNDVVRASLAAPAEPLATVVPPGTAADEAADAQWRIASATGTFDEGEQVLIRNRSQRGAPGEHVVTPLVLADGTAVLVNRGFVPTGRGEVPVPAPPGGEVIVQGRVRASQERGSFGPVDPADGELDVLSRVDIERIAEQVPYELAPVYLELTAPAPAGGLPEPIPAPELDDGPHLSYAGQWLLFCVLAVVGWFLVLRQSAKKERQRQARVARAHAALGEPLPDGASR